MNLLKICVLSLLVSPTLAMAEGVPVRWLYTGFGTSELQLIGGVFCEDVGNKNRQCRVSFLSPRKDTVSCKSSETYSHFYYYARYGEVNRQIGDLGGHVIRCEK